MIVDAVKTFEKIKQKLHESGDLLNRSVQFFGTQIMLVYVADLVDDQLINDSILQPICACHKQAKQNVVEELKENVLANCSIDSAQDLDAAIEKLLQGKCLLLVDGANEILAANVEKIVVRAIAEPPTSVVIKGPREGFNESIKYNLNLIRRRVKTDDLVVNTLDIGKLTKTQVAVVYFNSVADKKVVKHILKRLNDIEIDGVVDSHYLVSYLQKNPKSLFKQVGDTEKPDILVGKMLEGRVGILVDGSPIALTLPFILIEDLQNSDDYYSQPIRVTFVRILRFVGVILAVLLPGMYVALEKFHYKILPLEFLVTIMNTTQVYHFLRLWKCCL